MGSGIGRQEPHGVRGAWYPDPFGVAGERWHDGKKWTQETRGAPSPTQQPAGGERPRFRIAGSRPGAQAAARPGAQAAAVPGAQAAAALDAPPPPGRESPPARIAAARAQPTGFPVRMQELGDERLRVSPSHRNLLAAEWRKLGLRAWARTPALPHSYDVLAPQGPVGRLELGGRTALMRLACAEGTWSLFKRPGADWDLTIESGHGEAVGSYSGRHWVPGGHITVAEGPTALLRRSVSGHWTLQATEPQEPLADIRVRERGALTVRVYSRPVNMPEAHLVLLTACAVVTLERTRPGLLAPGVRDAPVRKRRAALPA